MAKFWWETQCSSWHESSSTSGAKCLWMRLKMFSCKHRHPLYFTPTNSQTTAAHYVFCVILCLVKKAKASHTRCRALGPELIPVYMQSARSHPPGGRLPLLSARPAVTFSAADHHRPLAGTKLYCLMTEAHRCTTCPRLLRSFCPGVQELNPRPVDRKSNALTVAPPRHIFMFDYRLLCVRRVGN